MTHGLPIEKYQQQIAIAIQTNNVLMIRGEAGCGKSTYVPLLIVQLSEPSNFPRILMTQPRRLAAKTIARRLASMLGGELGDRVGYAIGGDSARPGNRVTVVTTGWLLQVLAKNPHRLDEYTHVILDEVHERQLEQDFVSVQIKMKLQQKIAHGRPCFKLIVMSATLQGDLFAQYFGGLNGSASQCAPVIAVDERQYPIHTIFLDELAAGGPTISAKTAQSGLPSGLKDRLGHLSFNADSHRKLHSMVAKLRAPKAHGQQMGAFGHEEERSRAEVQEGLENLMLEMVQQLGMPGEGVLIFLPGLSEIYDMHDTLYYNLPWQRGRAPTIFKIFMLHSAIPLDGQEEALENPPDLHTCHVFLSTNMAESSITIPNLRIVVDLCMKREVSYDQAKRTSSLTTEWVSKASVQQRKGRCGRVFEGLFFEMVPRWFYNLLLEFDRPEMQIAPLETTFLQAKVCAAKLGPLGIGCQELTPSMLLRLTPSPPSDHNISSTLSCLHDMGAASTNSEKADIMLLGQVMIATSLDGKMASLICYCFLLECPLFALVVAAAASETDPFQIPHPGSGSKKDVAERNKNCHYARQHFADGQLSEHLMLYHLVVKFMQGYLDFKNQIVESNLKAFAENNVGQVQDLSNCVFEFGKQFRRTYENTIVPKRLIPICQRVGELAHRLLPVIPADSKLHGSLQFLKRVLNTDASAHRPEGIAEYTDTITLTQLLQPVPVLRAALVAAFGQHIVVGQVPLDPMCFKQIAHQKAKSAVNMILSKRMDPRHTLQMNIASLTGTMWSLNSPSFTTALRRELAKIGACAEARVRVSVAEESGRTYALVEYDGLDDRPEAAYPALGFPKEHGSDLPKNTIPLPIKLTEAYKGRRAKMTTDLDVDCQGGQQAMVELDQINSPLSILWYVPDNGDKKYIDAYLNNSRFFAHVAPTSLGAALGRAIEDVRSGQRTVARHEKEIPLPPESSRLGLVIGKQGANVQELKRVSGCEVVTPPTKGKGKDKGKSSSSIRVIGEDAAVVDACRTAIVNILSGVPFQAAIEGLRLATRSQSQTVQQDLFQERPTPAIVYGVFTSQQQSIASSGAVLSTSLDCVTVISTSNTNLGDYLLLAFNRFPCKCSWHSGGLVSEITLDSGLVLKPCRPLQDNIIFGSVAKLRQNISHEYLERSHQLISAEVADGGVFDEGCKSCRKALDEFLLCVACPPPVVGPVSSDASILKLVPSQGAQYSFLGPYAQAVPSLGYCQSSAIPSPYPFT